MDRQQFFTTGVLGIIAQGGPAWTGEYCRYRGPNNTKCAVGHSIPDKLYTPDMEHRVPSFKPSGFVEDATIAKAIGCETEEDATFARDFQKVHDLLAWSSRCNKNQNFISAFIKDAREFAWRHGLVMPPC